MSTAPRLRPREESPVQIAEAGPSLVIDDAILEASSKFTIE